MWIAIVGYGVAYSGWLTLSGRPCGFIDAFRGKCQPGAPVKTQSADTSSIPPTRVLSQQQQASMLTTTPIVQVQ